ncbi:hypothetical protein ACFQ1R_08160 [Mariniflexile jejuense]|uniref:PKD domain-containing protein n=1 Tax=Mariniflexile jejuense TaxID=1173582 RepID=A0ABW3JKF2_9FLAO
MKKIKILITSFLILGISFLISSCQPESYSLGNILDKSDIKYDISQDFSIDPGGNTVILTNKTKGVVLTWDYGTGKSNKAVETVKYAFKGDYIIKISAVTAGGIVELDPVTITVTDDNLNYVNDPLWTNLSGGVGKSKTWLLDLNAEGVSKYFAGPMFFYGTNMGWLEGGDNGCYGSDCWNWNPDWKGNEWLFPNGAQNFGTMTFNLINGPFVTTNNLSTGTNESGTYFLDKDNHTLSFTNASMLHDSGNQSCVESWTETKVFSLTENTMQLGVFRKDGCGGRVLLVFNFISKEYSDNWVPQDLPDPNPAIDLNGGTVDDLLSTTTTTTKTWHLSKDTPFNWTDLNGTFLNDWNSVADYEAAGWPGYISADQSTVIKNKISFSNDGKVTTVDSNGVQKTGTYSTEQGTNIISFSNITPSFPIGSSWATVSTTSQNQWKIVKTAKTGSLVTDIWFGKRDESGKNEYMVFHFVLDNPSADPDAEVKAILTGKTWKLDSNRSYNKTVGGISLQGPVIFSDFATWSWNPLPGEHYAAGNTGVDYGTMAFNTNGTMVVNQRTDSGIVTLNGNWSVTAGKLSITVAMLHPWTCDFAVASWTNIRTFKIENGALLLQANRDPALSGEDAFWITWVFVPAS